MRKTTVSRQTKETQIELSLNLDGNGKCSVTTGVGFLDHMLTLLAFHAGMDLDLRMQGDLAVDDHHTIEDAGIVFGQALRQLIGDKTGLARYGFFILPMDEVLARAVIDLSGRAYCHFAAQFKRNQLGGLATENIEEFFSALVRESAMTLHLEILSPGNDHHQAEALFKCFGRALREAVRMNARAGIPSTKGLLS